MNIIQRYLLFASSQNLPSKSAPKPELTVALSEVIEVSSATENAAAEPDTDYEEACGKKRKLKSTNTLCASKKLAPSNEKTDTSKVGKKAARPKEPKAPAVPTLTTSPMKGGPLSPLTVGSSSMAAPPESTAMRLRDGPSNDLGDVKKHVKLRPVTKGSKRMMKHALHVVYSNSDSQSEEDKDAKAEATTNCAVSKSTIVVHVQADEEELAPAVMPSIPNQAPDVPHIPIPQPDVPHPQAPRDSEPLHDGPHPQIPCGSEPLCDPPCNLDDIPHDNNRDPGKPLYNHHEHSCNPHAPLQYPREPLRHDPRGALRDPRDDI
ncbi:hypothetical protein EDB19DRAFT_1915290 [Suillus lakei]|nr:hypothetical protein EDB19DRAFT_1915290 [Suillus lakei]